MSLTQKNHVIKAAEAVTIRINQGDIYGIGYAGKSTLVRLLTFCRNHLVVASLWMGQSYTTKETIQLNAARTVEKRKDIGMIFNISI